MARTRKNTTLPALTVRELIEQLQQCDPDAIVMSPVWNGWTDTFGAIDTVVKNTFEEISNDFYGTEGKMDTRVTDTTSQNTVCLVSAFEHDTDVLTDKYMRRSYNI